MKFRGIHSLAVRKNEIKLKAIVYIISLLLVFLSVYPILIMLIDFSGFEFNNPARVLKIIPKRVKELGVFFNKRTVRGFFNSVFVAAGSTILNVYCSALTAHAIFAYKWRFRKVFSNLVLALMMIPNTVTSVAFIRLAYSYHMNNNLATLILPAIATPVSVVFMRLYLESCFSKEIIESARIDGAGEIRIFHQIVLPILKPAIATQAIFALAGSWTDMFLPMVLITEDSQRTLPLVLILNYALGDYMIPEFVSVIPLIIVYLLLARHIVEGIQLGSVKL